MNKDKYNENNKFKMNKQIDLINMILQHEGGYLNDSSDSGGRTYKGISENNFPNWKGWKIINKH